jgi:uncharacterized RDD family membrane protein YckC
LFDQALGEAEIGKYRTFLPRFCAGFIDGIVLLPVSLAVSWASSQAPMPVLVLLVLASGMIVIAYSVLLHGWYGQTVGKKLLGIKVLDLSESPLSMRQAFLRDLPWIVLSSLTMIWCTSQIIAGGNPLGFGQNAQVPPILNYINLLWFSVELVTMFTNAKRRALHDWIAGSVVVRT